MAFTPLVSPAVTPLETQFPSDGQFTVTGAYFSPLTSPALHAQNDLSSVFDQRLMTHTTNSPQEMDLESTPASNPGPTPNPQDLAKKARKNSAAKARAKSNVRQSPISKPQRSRKAASTPTLSAQILSELAETVEGIDPQVRQLAPTSTSSRAGTTDSENGSVSPEALSDMPPPPVPKPKSARPSPYMQPQNSAQPVTAPRMPMTGKPSPATPASLMKLPSPSISKNAASDNAGQGAPEHIENFELPESVAQSQQAQRPQRPQPSRLDTQMLAQVRSPSLDPGSAKSGAFQTLPSPSFTKPTSAASVSQSPQLMPGSSSAAAAARMTPTLAPRGSKKRASISSVHVSPALLPRISPNIKPLLPGGSSAEDTASQLLMSKSNYQNILEGNTVPGVWYPSELSTNLTSKRTSHKIAEQGRRNRINSALQEIATLLPKSAATAAADAAAAEGKGSEGDEAGSGGGDKKDKAGGANAPNSKASTVEMAIEYIKQLKQEVADATRRAEEAERKLEMKDKAG